jgi:beta-lactamase superfamily II metal-dependent hydrolase
MTEATVRMYNVGFGDCFLVQLPSREGTRTILFDCGTHPAGPGPRPISEVVENLIDDITDSDGQARIDVIVATHRHADHVSGFASKLWRDVEVGEVWMPWTENYDDPVARGILERQSRTAANLHTMLAARAVLDEREQVALALAENSLRNAQAMGTLHHGFNGQPQRRYLPDSQGSRLVTTPLLPGVHVHVLGPSRDPEVIKDMDPPAGAGYLRVPTPDPGVVDPFKPAWDIAIDDYVNEFPDLELKPYDRGYLTGIGDLDLFAVAVALEKSVNGTSLVLALEIDDALMLFPGDAQWGTWNAILQDPDARELLTRTTFWKVGHHGSHNATPRAFVEALAVDIERWSMLSTTTVGRWPEIPKADLVNAVNQLGGHLARSDHGTGSNSAGFHRYDQRAVEAVIPLRGPGSTH